MQKRWQMVTVHCVTKWCPHCSLVILKQIRFTNILFVANILCSNLFGRDLFLKFIQVESTFWRRTMVGKFFFLCLPFNFENTKQVHKHCVSGYQKEHYCVSQLYQIRWKHKRALHEPAVFCVHRLHCVSGYRPPVTSPLWNGDWIKIGRRMYAEED